MSPNRVALDRGAQGFFVCSVSAAFDQTKKHGALLSGTSCRTNFQQFGLQLSMLIHLKLVRHPVQERKATETFVLKNDAKHSSFAWDRDLGLAGPVRHNFATPL